MINTVEDGLTNYKKFLETVLVSANTLAGHSSVGGFKSLKEVSRQITATIPALAFLQEQTFLKGMEELLCLTEAEKLEIEKEVLARLNNCKPDEARRE